MNEDEMTSLYSYAVTASYDIGWDDTSTIEHRQYPCLYHKFPEVELQPLQQYFDTTPELDGWTTNRAVINLVTPSSINFRHNHGKDSRVLCYYMNPTWQEEFYGETIFYGKKGEDDRVVSYKPNRAVIFSGELPHSIRPASFVASSYRFTLSIFFHRET